MITPKFIVDILNEALKLDKKAIESIFLSSTLCNQKLVDHKTIQVRIPNPKDDIFYLGPLGLINGFVVQTGKAIYFKLDDDNNIKSFHVENYGINNG